MAKDFSFDVVSEVAMHEVANAVDQARREIGTRFYVKDTGTDLSQDDDRIELRTSSENRLRAALEVPKEKLVWRNVSLKALREGPVLPAARGSVRQSVNVNHGINDERAREVTKYVKGLRLKVQAQVMRDQVRITGRSKDDLQAAMRALKENDFGIPLQF